jgi:hypothetical protein
MIPKALPEFEKLTGIKVVVEDYPEDPFRQKLAVEMSAKSKSVDVFTTGTMREGRQFFTSGWYGDLTPLAQCLVDDLQTPPSPPSGCSLAFRSSIPYTRPSGEISKLSCSLIRIVSTSDPLSARRR